MGYTNNVEYILDEFKLLGLSIVPQKIEAGDINDILINCETEAGRNRVRHLIYSLLYNWGLKRQYQIRTQPQTGTILIRKAPALGGFKLGKSETKKFGNFSINGDLIDIMPTAESQAEQDALLAIINEEGD